MIEKKFVQIKKEEHAIIEFVKQELGKGRISDIRIEHTPVGEKITVKTSKPGLVIGRRGEKIADLTSVLKTEFKLENPHIEIIEIKNPDLDAKTIADEAAISLERAGPLKFKIVAYRTLERVKKAGALGAEMRFSGKLPSERAKSWRFAFGYLKKTGDTAKIVDRAQAVAQTIPGTIGIKVAILPPNVKIHDQINIEEVKNKVHPLIEEEIIEEKVEEKIKGKKKINKNKKLKQEKKQEI